MEPPPFADRPPSYQCAIAATAVAAVAAAAAAAGDNGAIKRAVAVAAEQTKAGSPTGNDGAAGAESSAEDAVGSGATAAADATDATALADAAALAPPAQDDDDVISEDDGSPPQTFRRFTPRSIVRITRRIAAEKRAAELAELEKPARAHVMTAQEEEKAEEEKPHPDAKLEVGKKLPDKYGQVPPEFFGVPIEDIDEFYHNKYVFMIIARDKTIFRFSATNGFFLLSPFNPIRRAAMFILTHPTCFSLMVMVVILVNCVFMAQTQEQPVVEKVFLGIYSVEGTVKMLARGYIVGDFTYLRDPWNWLDFAVVVLAYVQLLFPLGNVAVLRTFRVLRALKTVAVVPGLKTIVGALMEAVRRLRDVMILSCFLLSIFALVGLQIYQGTMRKKCVRIPDPLTYPNDPDPVNHTWEEIMAHDSDKANWAFKDPLNPKLCGSINGSSGGMCVNYTETTEGLHKAGNYTCKQVGDNPDFNFTSFDNFGWGMLCAFRLMTQDYWENLYQQVIRCNGLTAMIFFIIVIFFGSFYLVNVILAIVAMSYDDCRKQDAADADEAQAEVDRLAGLEEAALLAERCSPSNESATSVDVYHGGCADRGGCDGGNGGGGRGGDQISMKSDCGMDMRRRYSMIYCNRGDNKSSRSLPGSPFAPHRNKAPIPLALPPTSRRRSSQFSWRKGTSKGSILSGVVGGGGGDADGRVGSLQPMVLPCLDNLDLPYADDSAAVTPTSEDLCNFHNVQYLITGNSRNRLSHRISQLESRFTGNCRHETYILQHQPSPAAGGRWDGRYGAVQTPSSIGGGRTPWDGRNSMQQILPTPPRVIPPRAIEPTHFHWNTSSRRRKPNHLPPSTADGNGSGGKGGTPQHHRHHNMSTTSVTEWERHKDKMLMENPFLCRTPSVTTVDMNDVLVLKDLLKTASGRKRGCFGYEPGMSKKEFAKEKCMQIMFGWECCPLWYKIAHIIELFIMDAFVDLFITLCIVINTVFMALESDNMSLTLESILANGNYVFTTIFTVECGLKILALGLYKYLQDGWSCFDFVIVILSLVELSLENVKGLSILRSFRLLRVFKLAKSWPTLNLLIGIIGRTMGALGNLCFVLAIIVFIFAVMGMQLFGEGYKGFSWLEGDYIRWHFKDFLHSFMIVFRILCGEWIETMWACIRCNNYHCIPFFLLVMIIGNLVVLNLFLALLLSSFGAESLKHSEAEEAPNKLQEAVDRINRFVIYVKSHITYCIKVKLRRKALPLDYYYDTDTAPPPPPPGAGFTQDSIGQTDPEGTVVITIAPMGNGRIREQANSIPEEDADDNDDYDNRHRHRSHQDDDLREAMNNHRHIRRSNSIESEPSTIKAMSAHNSCRKLTHRFLSSSRSSLGSTEGGDGDSLGSSRSFMSSRSDGYSYSHDDDGTGSSVIIEKRRAGPEINEVNVVFVRYPDDCFPKKCTSLCSCWAMIDRTNIGQVWWKFRCHMYTLVEHTYFETFIITMILASSLALYSFAKATSITQVMKEILATKATRQVMTIDSAAVDDKNVKESKIMQDILWWLDQIFTVIFVCEMFIKMSAYGFKKYFTDAWCWLDFVIVAISLIGVGATLFAEDGAGNMGAFRALRTLRALRPLRAVSRWEGMKVVVNALIQAIPAIFNVLLVCLVFWLIFSIMGVNLFGGRYGKCLDAEGNPIFANETTPPMNKHICANYTANGANYSWSIPDINFDNVLIGYLSLFQVATFKGWMDIMYAAIDSREKGEQPWFETRSMMYLYFVLFIVFGSFFTLNLFIGVIIENFNMQKKKITGGSLEMLMTEDQKKYYNAMKKLGSKQPTKPIPKPKLYIQLLIFQLIKNQKFDIVIMGFILLNMISMMMEYYDQPTAYENVLNYLNGVFIVIFSSECVLKMLGLRQYYFKEPWNVFDFVVVVLSIITLSLPADSTENLPISPTLLRVIRVFRVGRVLRLVKSAKGIRTLLFSLAVSLPALFNIALLLALVMFIFAIMGMSSFMNAQHNAGIDDMFNFETFFNSMMILFQSCTSAGWDGVLAGLMANQHCDERPHDKECGDNSALGIVYIVSYLVITFLVIVNMYIAVILENFSQATEDVQQGLTQDDFDMYYEKWEQFDPEATQYIVFDQLSAFVDILEEPLRIPAPNLYKLVSMNIPIVEGDRIHCVDILDALTKNFLGTGSEDAGELGDLKKGPERVDYHPISTTLKRQREIFVARVIQRQWRRYMNVKKEARDREAAGLPPEDAATTAATRNEEIEIPVIIAFYDGVTSDSPHRAAVHDTGSDWDPMGTTHSLAAVLSSPTSPTSLSGVKR